MKLDGLVMKIDTEEEYRASLRCLEEWMADGDREAPPYVENLIKAIVDYEAIHYPMEWEEE